MTRRRKRVELTAEQRALRRRWRDHNGREWPGQRDARLSREAADRQAAEREQRWRDLIATWDAVWPGLGRRIARAVLAGERDRAATPPRAGGTSPPS